MPSSRPAKTHPYPPDLPPRYDPAPEALESGDRWDGVSAGPEVRVAGHVAGLQLQETRWDGADLSGRRLGGLRSRDSLFVRCDLSGAMLDGAALERVAFVDCRLTGLVLSGADLVDVLVTDGSADLLNLRMARARHLLVENTSLRGADLYAFAGTDCALLGCDLTGATFDEARLTRLRLHGSTLEDVRGVLALRGARIGRDQMVPLGAALLAALEISVTEG